MNTSGAYRGRRDGRLTVLCWCEDRHFDVPAELVRRGETVSCGRRFCLSPTDRARLVTK